MQKTHIAKGKCKTCKEILVSERGGHFVGCKCKQSFIDQERMSGAHVRIGGELELFERTCPENCIHPEHQEENLKINK